MKKLLLGTALALLYAGSAFAGHKTISLDGYCDVYTLTSQETKKVISSSSLNTGCDDNAGIGGVVHIKSEGGLFAEIGANLFGTGNEVWKIKLSYPIATGGTWELDVSTDGKTFTFVNSGTYTVTGAGVHGTGNPASAGR